MSKKQTIALIYFLLVGKLVEAMAPAPDSLPRFRHDYAHTLVMKMFLAKPDGNGGSMVNINFETALSLIKQVDALTLQYPKIIYLVGATYNGHDDQYPAFFEINKKLKRPQDTGAAQSLAWLMREARKYHTTVSLHINMTEAYDNSPLWNTYVKEGLISRNADGSMMVTGNYNNHKAYQINYRNEWNKGYAKMRIDSLLKVVPELKNAGTIHIDAWIARENKGAYETVVTEAAYQKKIAQYWISRGIDPTSEWAMDYMTGLVPYYWHFNHRTQEDFLNTPAGLVTGGHFNPDLKQSDFGLEFLFGTSMYGENLFPGAINNNREGNWQAAFCKDFYLNTVQYNFLNGLKRLRVEGAGSSRVAYFSNGVQVSLRDSTVYEGSRQLRSGNRACFPAAWRNDNSLVAFSLNDAPFNYQVPDSWKGVHSANVFIVEGTGLKKWKTVPVTAQQFSLQLKPGMPVLLVPGKR
ncbi:endo-alpha-N-acetylgalactosaminidase family protein [Niabella sp. CC-SYL272]|uniref:endo-alpha-N-acetylgalactosaminidase family protein n=1 Tax=Niabella agricola TaxID=2891571 RepID=UPI001F36BF3D|nr:endo-alpha-N-acetylgalactosaminidase family protein [Niabella agricola]MCF3107358.1 endo-alpha-N-acetylgalactosaminidase family protein [Niabella agricola]